MDVRLDVHFFLKKITRQNRYICMKIDITIPESLSEITLSQYQKFIRIQQTNDDEQFLTAKMIEIFCDIDPSHVMKLRVSDANAIVETLTDMLQQKSKLVKKFKMNGVQYGWIPELDSMTFGEYVDLDTHISDWDGMEKAMAVLYRPIKNEYGHKYEIEEYDIEQHTLMGGMPMDAVLGTFDFFLNLGNELSQIMMNYSTKQRETNLVQYINSDQNGVGSKVYSDYLAGILQNLNISQN